MTKLSHHLIAEGINNQVFNDFNPLFIDEGGRAKSTIFSTPAGIINEALKYLFPIAGLILFLMIVWGGFEMLSSAASSKSKDAGKQRITAAVIGFLLLFASYWIIQIVQVIFRVSIVSP
jgi:hypothetical protein